MPIVNVKNTIAANSNVRISGQYAGRVRSARSVISPSLPRRHCTRPGHHADDFELLIRAATARDLAEGSMI